MAARRRTAAKRPTLVKSQSAPPQWPHKRTAPRADSVLPIVAIGASAGGLEAFRELLGALSPQTGMAFILVQHLDPVHPSLMPQILSAHTTMPVVQASEVMTIEPNHVYLIPPARYLTVGDGALHLPPSSGEESVRMPFDALLTSLAEERGSTRFASSSPVPPRMAPSAPRRSNKRAVSSSPRTPTRPTTKGCRAMPSIAVSSISFCP